MIEIWRVYIQHPILNRSSSCIRFSSIEALRIVEQWWQHDGTRPPWRTCLLIAWLSPSQCPKARSLLCFPRAFPVKEKRLPHERGKEVRVRRTWRENFLPASLWSCPAGLFPFLNFFSSCVSFLFPFSTSFPFVFVTFILFLLRAASLNTLDPLVARVRVPPFSLFLVARRKIKKYSGESEAENERGPRFQHDARDARKSSPFSGYECRLIAYVKYLASTAKTTTTSVCTLYMLVAPLPIQHSFSVYGAQWSWNHPKSAYRLIALWKNR